jgi:hypothetical protein
VIGERLPFRVGLSYRLQPLLALLLVLRFQGRL